MNDLIIWSMFFWFLLGLPIWAIYIEKKENKNRLALEFIVVTVVLILGFIYYFRSVL